MQKPPLSRLFFAFETGWPFIRTSLFNILGTNAKQRYQQLLQEREYRLRATL